MGVKTAGEMIKTKLVTWDIGSNMGKEWHYLCGEREALEHILDCKKIKEVIKKKVMKE